MLCFLSTNVAVMAKCLMDAAASGCEREASEITLLASHQALKVMCVFSLEGLLTEMQLNYVFRGV